LRSLAILLDFADAVPARTVPHRRTYNAIFLITGQLIATVRPKEIIDWNQVDNLDHK
jgi:hypothetical protein